MQECANAYPHDVHLTLKPWRTMDHLISELVSWGGWQRQQVHRWQCSNGAEAEEAARGRQPRRWGIGGLLDSSRWRSRKSGPSAGAGAHAVCIAACFLLLVVCAIARIAAPRRKPTHMAWSLVCADKARAQSSF